VALAVKAINRAALANVPVVGTTITSLMGVYGAEYQQRRIDALTEELTAVYKAVALPIELRRRERILRGTGLQAPIVANAMDHPEVLPGSGQSARELGSRRL
jgi:hypothetical protein